MFHSKMLEGINHIKNISKQELTVDNIHKYMIYNFKRISYKYFYIIDKGKIMWKFMEAETKRNSIM